MSGLILSSLTWWLRQVTRPLQPVFGIVTSDFQCQCIECSLGLRIGAVKARAKIVDLAIGIRGSSCAPRWMHRYPEPQRDFRFLPALDVRMDSTEPTPDRDLRRFRLGIDCGWWLAHHNGTNGYSEIADKIFQCGGC